MNISRLQEEIGMIVSLVDMSRELRDRIARETGETVAVCRSGEEERVLPQAEIMIGHMNPGQRRLELARRLRWYFCISAGVEKLPFAYLREHGITVTNSSGMHGPQMSEHALGMMIAFSRGLLRSVHNQRRHVWERDMMLGQLAGSTLCVVGAGSIGQATARRARAFDMKVIGLRRHPGPVEFFDEIGGMDRLHEALGLADYVLLLTPLTRETRGLMGAAEFAAMKKSAVFLNLSRGGTVDEEALTAALRDGVIAGAGLDVFGQEPLDPASPLWDMENVLITPHVAGILPHYVELAADVFIRSYDSYRRGEPLPNRVDLAGGY